MNRIAVIGTGIVGSAVALLLGQKGYPVTGVCSKTGVAASQLAACIGCPVFDEPAEALPSAEVIFITTPDREVENIAYQLAESGRVKTGQVFFHMSGALPAEILTPLTKKGAAAGSIHPLQSFASVEKAAANLAGSFFAIQGEERAVETAFKIVNDLSGHPFIIKNEDKPMYHLGACIASNYLVTLIHSAVRAYRHIGMTGEQAVEALMPLIKGTLANIAELGPARALTGPVARGDLGTVSRHLEAIEAWDPGLADLYKTLGRYTVKVAVEKKSLDENRAQRLLCMFREGEDDCV
ncbi:MAG: DUF2520 domain-containing protein [Firmicutes bacterium HGW-Firmicutes-14]|jgi:predicted short-subunit dehydrogenase-like oxidoreductase (DUF2520 family)|nr:MAG: DUF2520 domain-containing protein [Firmicutes bacterium HGW-Firmicutes-14]